MSMTAKLPSCGCEHSNDDVVLQVSKRMLPDSDVQGLSSLFKILGDPTRIRIMWALEQTEMCVCDLAASLNMTKSAISHQLSTLKQVKLVKYRRSGKNVFYSLDDEHVNNIIDMGLAHIRE